MNFLITSKPSVYVAENRWEKIPKNFKLLNLIRFFNSSTSSALIPFLPKPKSIFKDNLSIGILLAKAFFKSLMLLIVGQIWGYFSRNE